MLDDGHFSADIKGQFSAVHMYFQIGQFSSVNLYDYVQTS